MKVLLLHSDSIMQGQTIGGLGVVVQNLMKFWGEDDELYIVSFGGKDFQYSKNISHKAVKYKMVPNIPHATYRAFFIQPNLMRVALDFPAPDVVVGCDWNCSFAAKQLALHYGVPYVFWSHISPLSYCVKDEMDLIRTEAAIEVHALEQADAVLHVSESYAASFPFFLFAHKTAAIHNGVDLQDFEYKSEKSPFRYPEKFNVVFLGRAAKQKGIDKLIKTALPENCVLNFCVMDNKNTINGFETILYRLAEADPERYQFIGQVNGDVKSNYLRWADALIVPSLSEPFGLVGLEGLAAKTLVISTMVEGLGDFLHEDFAIKCLPEPDSISEAIRKAQSLSKEQREQMIECGYCVAQAHDWRMIVPKLKDFFKQTIK